ncbi:MAG: damage-control phosphatase ARMT1 family protein [Chloroflexi bacterium]|nr:damage-control phosphatase ARMT1 family protein [Chloroflexota bacterium]
MAASLSPPPPIRTDHSNAFAHNTMAVRIPAIMQETLDLNPDYPTSIKDRLGRLRDDIGAGKAIPLLEAEAASDYQQWLLALRQQQNSIGASVTWHNAEWFFAETYAYRCLVEATRYFESRRDPFAPKKKSELTSEALWSLIEGALASDVAAEQGVARAVMLDLWANRIDLSYAASLERGTDITPEDLLVDDSDHLLNYLCRSATASGQKRGEGAIYIVADNAGSELAMDLVLADRLLRHVTDRVVLYLKAHPTFVSDATPEDVWIMLAEMKRRRGASAQLAERLTANWESARLLFLPHQFWNSSALLRDMPSELHNRLNASRLVIIKGDANYRRAIGDCLWPAESPFRDVMSYLDAPVLCLRTLKSDPIVGLPSAAIAKDLDRSDPTWRVNGKRGLIQFKPQSSNSQ